MSIPTKNQFYKTYKIDFNGDESFTKQVKTKNRENCQ